MPPKDNMAKNCHIVLAACLFFVVDILRVGREDVADAALQRREQLVVARRQPLAQMVARIAPPSPP